MPPTNTAATTRPKPRSKRRARAAEAVQKLAEGTHAFGPSLLRDLRREATVDRGLCDREAVVVARAEPLGRQQFARHLDQMALVSRSMQRRVAVVVAREQEVGREL